MPREVKTWVGVTPDAMPPPRVRLRIFHAHGGRCQLTGRMITPQDRWVLDHKVALCNNGRNTEDNLWPVLEDAHKAKTATDVAEKARVDARAKSHLGIATAEPTMLAGRPRDVLEATKAAKGAGKLPVPPRAWSFYADVEPPALLALPAPTRGSR